MKNRPILSLKPREGVLPQDGNWHRGKGVIRYDPPRPGMKRRTDWWCIIDVDREITRYYRWWIDREILNITGVDGFGLKQPSWDAHITIIRGANDIRQVPPEKLKALWKKYNGMEVEFLYQHNVRQSGDTTGGDRPDHYWFIDVECPKGKFIRDELGLPSHWKLHLTVGRTYD